MTDIPKDIDKLLRRMANLMRRRPSRMLIGVPGLSMWISPRLRPRLWRKRKTNGHTFLSFGILCLSVMLDWRAAPPQLETVNATDH